MPPVLHSLNSLRVLAEFCVVRVHLADNFGSQYGWLPNTFVKEDVMSFFFVLSGFVTAYSHAAEEPRDRLEYLGRRVGKMLPPFLLSCLLDLPGAAITQYRAGCDPPAPSSFSCCRLGRASLTLRGSRRVSWYLECLVWLWMAFAFLKMDLLFRGWRAAAGLYALSWLLY